MKRAAADPAAVAEVAKLLVAAEHPVIVVDRVARTPEAIRHLIDLAETLQAAVVDRKQFVIVEAERARTHNAADQDSLAQVRRPEPGGRVARPSLFQAERGLRRHAGASDRYSER